MALAHFSVPLTSADVRTTGIAIARASNRGRCLTEAAPACLLSRADQPNRRGPTGTAVAGTEVTVRNAASSAAFPNETEGETCVRENDIAVRITGDVSESAERK